MPRLLHLLHDRSELLLDHLDLRLEGMLTVLPFLLQLLYCTRQRLVILREHRLPHGRNVNQLFHLCLECFFLIVD